MVQANPLQSWYTIYILINSSHEDHSAIIPLSILTYHSLNFFIQKEKLQKILILFHEKIKKYLFFSSNNIKKFTRL